MGSALLLGPYKTSLADTSREILGLEPPKALQLSDWGAQRLSCGQICYAASDAVLAFKLWPIIANLLQARSRWQAYEIERKVLVPVTAMQLVGVGFDAAEHARQVAEWERDRGLAEEWFLLQQGRALPTDRGEVRELLQSVLTEDEITAWAKTKKGLLSTSYGHLLRLVDTVPGMLALINALALDKLLTSFGKEYAARHVRDGRIFPQYNIGGAKTGRFSSRDPNIQQLPSRRSQFRRCIVPAPGCVLIEGDFSQVELRACAEIAEIPALRKLYEEEGRDLHSETASRVHGEPIRKGDPRRNPAKAINFETIYGGGPAMLAYQVYKEYQIIISEEQALQYQNVFFGIAVGLRPWMRRQATLCRRRGYIEIGCGRVVEASWMKDGEIKYTQAVNYPVQGVCADCMMRALVYLYQALRGAGIRCQIINSAHDSILLEAAEEDAGQAIDLLREAMFAAFRETFPKASTRDLVELKIGRNWGEMQTVATPIRAAWAKSGRGEEHA